VRGFTLLCVHVVMAGLVPAIHVFATSKKGVDARVKPGHDEFSGADSFRLTYVRSNL
jgi:hypothetical protein